MDEKKSRTGIKQGYALLKRLLDEVQQVRSRRGTRQFTDDRGDQASP